jgi:hypothetical protein
MRKIQQVSFGLASVLIAAALVNFDTSLAMACSFGSSSSGLNHGSKMGSGSVAVCVGSSTSSPGSSTTQTITKTVTVPVPPKSKPEPKPAPKTEKKPAKKPAKKPSPKPTSKITSKPVAKVVSCPTASQMASMPRSADAAERWVESICSPAPRVVAAPKPTPKPTPKTKTVTITETITVDVPGNYYAAADVIEFEPNPLIADVFPATVLSLGQLARFSSNPKSHFGSGVVLGRQAEVHFVPVRSSWKFSDGAVQQGADTQREFQTAGKYQIRAFVEYLVSYRLVGESAWQAVDGTLLIDSNPLEVVVEAFGYKADQSTQRVLLVGADCLGRAGVFGCDI